MSSVMVKRASFANGLNDVAKCMGLSPKQLVLLHNGGSNPDDYGIHCVNNFASRFRAVVGLLAHDDDPEGNAKAVVFPLNPTLLAYYERYHLCNTQDLVILSHDYDAEYARNLTVYDLENLKKQYQVLSLSCNALADIQNGSLSMREQLSGKSFLASISNSDDLRLAQAVNGQVLIDTQQQIQLTSKINLHIQSTQFGYQVPLGITIEERSNLRHQLQEFRQEVRNAGYDPDTVGWCFKLEDEVSGHGFYAFDGLTDENITSLEQTLDEFCTQRKQGRCGRMLVELNISKLPGVQNMESIGVLAVIGEEAIHLLGSNTQKILKGRYIGSEIDEAVYQSYYQMAETEATKFFQYVHTTGYRGPIGLDVLVSFDGEQYQAYCIDPNVRITGAAPVMCMYQYAKLHNPNINYAIMFFNFLQHTDDCAKTILDFCGDTLFRGAESNYQGIFPLSVPQNTLDGSDRVAAKIITIGENKEDTWKIYNAFKDKLKALAFSAHPELRQ